MHEDETRKHFDPAISSSVQGVEAQVLGESRDSILTPAQFQTLLQSNGFTTGTRGTLFSPELDVYLYLKRQYEFENFEDVKKAFAVVQFLTEKGIFYPGTNWSIAQSDKGLFILFPVTRKLIVPDPATQATPSDWQKLVSPRQLLNDEGIDVTLDEWRSTQMWSEDSHIVQWYRRLEPSYQVSNRPTNPLFQLLNLTEASHFDNWGWSEEGLLYPVDIEVVSLNDPRSLEVIRRWRRDDS